MKIALAVLVVIAAFVLWRYTSVSRGASARDETLLKRLDPVGERLGENEPVSQEEIAQLAKAPELRPLIHQMLSHYERLELFPPAYLSREAEAESVLVYWLMHPNELQAAPASVELVEKVEHAYGSRSADFYVFKYMMPEGHWAGTGWLLGLAGPFFPDEKPYESVAGGFSRAGDAVGSVTPRDLVAWYADMHAKKFSRGA